MRGLSIKIVRLFMFFSLTSLLLLLSCGENRSLTSDELGTQRRAIINGHRDLAYPSVGALTADKRPFCTGTLIASRVVLTAAHCVEAFAKQPNKKLEYRIDIPYASRKYRSIYAEIDRNASKMHPKFSGTQTQLIHDDVAVVILKQPVFVAPPMPWNKKAATSSWIGRKVKFMGYGVLSATATQPSPHKYSTIMKIVQIDGKGPRGASKVNTIGYLGNNTSVCHGDSGGPALMEINGRYILIAMTSHGTSRDCTGISFSYRTDPYVSWIEGFLKKYATCQDKSDCGPCAACHAGVCEPYVAKLPKTYCAVCKSDADCQGGHCLTIGEGSRCVFPCSKSGCCPKGLVCGTDTSGKSYCLPEKMACPPVACKKDSDCSPKEVCVKGFCKRKLPKLDPKTCWPCQKHTDCGSNGYCDTPDGRGGNCLQACVDGYCPQGMLCKKFAPGIERCVYPDRTCPIPCQTDKNCPKDYTCTNKQCLRKGGARDGELCSATNPCVQPLKCISNPSGARCYRVCGYPVGAAGAPCRPDGTCDNGLMCQRNPMSGGGICIESCQGGKQCSLGGRCLMGQFCMCQSDSECTKGGRCNKFMQFGGACTKQQPAPCPSGETCASNPGKPSVCIRKGAGRQGVGQKCDQIKACKSGLTCLPMVNICMEECTKTGVCKDGGACRSLQGGMIPGKYCICSQNAPCKKGLKCTEIQKGFGYCEADTTQGCKSDEACPQGFVCRQGQCVQGTSEPSTSSEKMEEKGTLREPSLEKRAEEKSVGAEKMSSSEKIQDAGPTEKVIGEKSVGTEGTSSTTDKSATVGKKGCGCSTQHDDSPSLFFLLFVLLVGFPFFQPRRKKF